MNIEAEARQALNHMASFPESSGALPTAVVDYMVREWSDTVFCQGTLRQIVFTPVTPNTYRYKTEPVWRR